MRAGGGYGSWCQVAGCRVGTYRGGSGVYRELCMWGTVPGSIWGCPGPGTTGPGLLATVPGTTGPGLLVPCIWSIWPNYPPRTL